MLARCADDSARAAEVQAIGAAATPAEHTYVPWVVLDGKVIEDADQWRLEELVCKAYKGPLPKVCWDFVEKDADERRVHGEDSIGLAERRRACDREW